MTNREHQARFAALSILQCRACANLLRAHGEFRHAENLAAALDAVAKIVARKLGRETLNAALDWASDRLSSDPPPAGKYLN